MGRRYRQSPLEDLIEIASYLPWWVSILLAIISYLILHSLAIDDAITDIQGIKKTSEIMTHAVTKGILTGMQYIIPIAFTGGAIVWAIKRRK
jgi:restriction system protein